MRRFAIACAALLLFAAPSHAADIKTGRDLVNACSSYIANDARQDNNAARAPHPCRTFLLGFFQLCSKRVDLPSRLFCFVPGSLGLLAIVGQLALLALQIGHQFVKPVVLMMQPPPRIVQNTLIHTQPTGDLQCR